MENYTIILSDGIVLDNLKLNGNNYISTIPLTEDIFKNNLIPVVIITNEVENHHEHMKLIQVKQYGNEYWFVLEDVSEEEIRASKLRADIEYIAMMTDIEL